MWKVAYYFYSVLLSVLPISIFIIDFIFRNISKKLFNFIEAGIILTKTKKLKKKILLLLLLNSTNSYAFSLKISCIYAYGEELYPPPPDPTAVFLSFVYRF